VSVFKDLQKRKKQNRGSGRRQSRRRGSDDTRLQHGDACSCQNPKELAAILAENTINSPPRTEIAAGTYTGRERRLINDSLEMEMEGEGSWLRWPSETALEGCQKGATYGRFKRRGIGRERGGRPLGERTKSTKE